MGAVYVAQDRELGNKKVAVKFLLKDNVDKDNVEWINTHFDQEIQVLSTIDHPHIVRILDRYDPKSDSPRYFVMEFVNGGDLESRFKREGAFDCKTAANITIDAASALKAVHGNGIYHRDIKPSNILLDGDVVKVTDFGIARVAGGNGNTTQEGYHPGTPIFQAPEQFDPNIYGKVGPETDIYALGEVMYWCVTGQYPFSGDPVQNLSAKCRCEYKPPHDFNPEVDGTFEAIIAKCLQPKKEDRYRTAQELIDALNEYLDSDRVKEKRPGKTTIMDRLARQHTFVVSPEAAGFADVEGHLFQLVDSYGEVEYLEHVVQCSMTRRHTLLLGDDGTVSGQGSNDDGELDFGGIEKARFVAAAPYCSYIVTSDGRVTVRGSSPFADVLSQAGGKPVREVSCEDKRLLLLHDDGTLTVLELSATGAVERIACDFADVRTVRSAGSGSVALCGDEGKVAFIGAGDDPRRVSGWKGMHAIAIDDEYAYALRGDGTVAFAGSDISRYDGGRPDTVASWHGIVAIDARYSCVGALDVDGRLHLAGDFEYAEGLVDGWPSVILE